MPSESFMSNRQRNEKWNCQGYIGDLLGHERQIEGDELPQNCRKKEKDERRISIFSYGGKSLNNHYETVGHHQSIRERRSKNHCRLFSEDTGILLHSDQENLAVISKHLRNQRKKISILI